MRKLLLFLMISLCVSLTAQTKIIVSCKPVAAPVFIGAEKNIVSHITAESSLDAPAALSSFSYNAGKESARYITSVKIYVQNGKKDSLIGISEKPVKQSGTVALSYSLPKGKTILKIALEISSSISIESILKFKCASITIGKKKYPAAKEFTDYRIGHVIRKPGDYNVKSYRIPGLAMSNKGTLLAVYDIRKNNSRDLPADIDVGLSRSTDEGQTWLPMQVIMDMGEPHDQNGIGDPSILVDKNSGTIWVAALWSKGNRGWNGSGPGLTPDETGQFIIVKSTDDGVTWSAPINITTQVKNPKWRLFFQGPGNGITLSNGTLVFPAQFRDSSGIPYSTIIYSYDKGKTWKAGKGAKSNTTEAQIVELTNGLLMLNMRDNRGGSRSVAVSSDMGETWIEHSSSRSELIEPVCMASFIRVAFEVYGIKNSVLAFSNPANKKNRDSLTVKFSLDEGKTWRGFKNRPILIDERDSYGYSCLTKINENYLGLLYEGIDDILFVKVKIPEGVIKKEINDFEGAGSVIRKK